MSNQSGWARILSVKSHFGDDRNTAAGALGTLYFGLLYTGGNPGSITGDPGGAGTEPSSLGGYARVAKSNANTFLTVDTGLIRVTNTGSAITFPTTTGLYSITAALDAWGIWDNSTGGNLRYFGRLLTPILVTGAGDTPRIDVGQWIYRGID